MAKHSQQPEGAFPFVPNGGETIHPPSGVPVTAGASSCGGRAPWRSPMKCSEWWVSEPNCGGKWYKCRWHWDAGLLSQSVQSRAGRYRRPGGGVEPPTWEAGGVDPPPPTMALCKVTLLWRRRCKEKILTAPLGIQESLVGVDSPRPGPWVSGVPYSPESRELHELPHTNYTGLRQMRHKKCKIK